MRAFGILVDSTVRLRPSALDQRLERANPPPVRRLEEQLTEVFNQACLDNELEAAADLLALMAQWHARRTYRDAREQQIGAIHLRRLYCELERRHIMRGRPRTRG